MKIISLPPKTYIIFRMRARLVPAQQRNHCYAIIGHQMYIMSGKSSLLLCQISFWSETLNSQSSPMLVPTFRQAERYSNYARVVYDLLPDALLAAGQLVGGRSGVYRPSRNPASIHINSKDEVSLFSCYRLSDFGFPNTALFYAIFENGILATPYAVLVDEEDKSVVISIRGTATLEDLVRAVCHKISRYAVSMPRTQMHSIHLCYHYIAR